MHNFKNDGQMEISNFPRFLVKMFNYSILDHIYICFKQKLPWWNKLRHTTTLQIIARLVLKISTHIQGVRQNCTPSIVELTGFLGV